VNAPKVYPLGGRWQRFGSVLWLVVATGLTLAAHLRQLDSPFDWAGAHSATMARSFVQSGVLELRGVPVENNPPLGLEPERYVHWPPLYQILLSVLFRLFGESESVARGFQLAIVLAHAVLLLAVGVAVSSDVRVGLLSAFAWLTVPVVSEYGTMVYQLHLAMLATTLALGAFVRAVGGGSLHHGWALVGAGSLAVGVLVSWEPLMVIPGLVAAAWWIGGRSHRRLALLHAAAAGLAVGAVFGLFFSQAPSLVGDLLDTARYRAGISEPSGDLTLRNFFIYSRHPQLPLTERLATIAGHTLVQVGPIALLAIAWTVVRAWRRRSDDALRMVLAGWLSVPVFWTLFLSNHMLHRFQHALFAPLAALSLALGLTQLADLGGSLPRPGWRLAVRVLALGALPALLSASVLRAAHDPPAHRDPSDVAYARAIGSATGPDAVVVTAEESMVPVYYSRRHVVRAVPNDAALQVSLPDLRRRFGCAPLYLALRPGRTGGFELALERYRAVHRSRQLLLLELDPVAAVGSRSCGVPQRGSQ
jgi:hypothetical protein